MVTKYIANIRGKAARLAIASVAVMPLAVLTGCNNGPQGAFSGAALGSLIGMGMGSLTGDMGKGAAAGALLGAGAGAVLGDQNARSSSRSGTYYAEQPVYYSAPRYERRTTRTTRTYRKTYRYYESEYCW